MPYMFCDPISTQTANSSDQCWLCQQRHQTDIGNSATDVHLILPISNQLCACTEARYWPDVSNIGS